jgi:hypothetical protein
MALEVIMAVLTPASSDLGADAPLVAGLLAERAHVVGHSSAAVADKRAWHLTASICVRSLTSRRP